LILSTQKILSSLKRRNNIGIVELKENSLFIVSNHRSLVASKLEALTAHIKAFAWLDGAKT
jgi:tRNA pseudouridine-54 N-methylase